MASEAEGERQTESVMPVVAGGAAIGAAVSLAFLSGGLAIPILFTVLGAAGGGGVGYVANHWPLRKKRSGPEAPR
jgi:hypothetical protein